MTRMDENRTRKNEGYLDSRAKAAEQKAAEAAAAEQKAIEAASADFSENVDFSDVFLHHKGHGLKTLVSLYKGNYFRLFLSFVFFCLKQLPVWILPIFTAQIINAVVNDEPDASAVIISRIVITAVILALNVPFNYIHVRLYSKSIRKMEAGLRSSLVRKLQQLSISYHKEMQSGRLQSKIMRDVEAIEGLSSQVFISMLAIITNIIVALAMTVGTNLTVFFFFLVTVPVAALIIVSFRSRIRDRNSAFRREIEDTSARVMEMVELVPVTRAHGLEQWEIDHTNAYLRRIAVKGYRLDVVQSMFGSVSWAVFQGFQLLCLGFTAFLAFGGKIEVGDITMYQTYFGQVVGQVSAIIALLPTISKGLESVRSVSDVLLAHDVEDNTGKIKLSDIRGDIEFKDVHFEYADGDREVLSGFNLSVKAGETIALVGESGAGKSTVLNMVIGFNLPTSGSITIDDNEITDLDLHEYRTHLAVVPQTSLLFTGTLRDNITYGSPDVSEERLNRAIDAANLRELVESLPHGLDTLISEHGGNLSGGQRQRVSIARAIIRDPEIIVLDEATSALDSVSERKIQDALSNLIKGRTTFIVAHRLSTIRDADRIAVVNGGKCVEEGTYEELMAKKGEFYKLKKLQS